MTLLTADERAVRDIRVLKLYTTADDEGFRSIRDVAEIVGLSPARVRDILTQNGEVRHRGDPGAKPGPRPDPDAASHRTPIAYRPDKATRNNIERWAVRIGMSRTQVVDHAVKHYFANQVVH
jgi:hypothetical protein